MPLLPMAVEQSKTIQSTQTIGSVTGLRQYFDTGLSYSPPPLVTEQVNVWGSWREPFISSDCKTYILLPVTLVSKVRRLRESFHRDPDHRREVLM